MTDDPFSQEADPYPVNALALPLSRREVAALWVALPLLTSACTAARVACRPTEAHQVCEHRFCRHYRGAIP